MTERKPLEPVWQVNDLGDRRALYTADQIRKMVEEVRTLQQPGWEEWSYDYTVGFRRALDALLAQLEKV